MVHIPHQVDVPNLFEIQEDREMYPTEYRIIIRDGEMVFILSHPFTDLKEAIEACQALNLLAYRATIKVMDEVEQRMMAMLRSN